LYDPPPPYSHPPPHSPPQTDIAKLLRFESSRKEKGELVSLDDYCDRMVDGQDVCAPRLLVSLGGGALFPIQGHSHGYNPHG